jgi:hypothetical protein
MRAPCKGRIYWSATGVYGDAIDRFAFRDYNRDLRFARAARKRAENTRPMNNVVSGAMIKSPCKIEIRFNLRANQRGFG